MSDSRSAGAVLSPPARLTLFGHDATPARVELVPRGPRWRAFRALRVLAVALVVAPLVGLVPPHAPWALGALVAGAVLAWRRWQETHTVTRVEGRCPRCDASLVAVGPARLRSPHGVPCEACHHESALEVEL